MLGIIHLRKICVQKFFNLNNGYIIVFKEEDAISVW